MRDRSYLPVAGPPGRVAQTAESVRAPLHRFGRRVESRSGLPTSALPHLRLFVLRLTWG